MLAISHFWNFVFGVPNYEWPFSVLQLKKRLLGKSLKNFQLKGERSQKENKNNCLIIKMT